jgi:hypothetical protein
MLGPLIAAAAPESPTPTPGAVTTVIALPPLTPAEQADQLLADGPKGALRLGFGRPLPSDQHPGTPRRCAGARAPTAAGSPRCA